MAAMDETPAVETPVKRGGAPKIGVWAWSFVGVVIATIIVVTALAAVSEIFIPLLFAAVLAVIFKPVVGSLSNHGFKPSLAAGLLVLGADRLDDDRAGRDVPGGRRPDG